MAKGAYIGVPKPEYEPIFKNNSWIQIIKACQKNEVPSTWSVGDQKDMTINGTDYAIDIIGKNHDTYSDGSGTAPLTFQMHDCYATQYKLHDSELNKEWSVCTMYTTNLPAILSLMPTEVQSGIKEVNKLTLKGANSFSVGTTADKLFLLSEIEVAGTSQSSSYIEGTQYEYYKVGNSAIKKRSGSADTWHLRTPVYNSGGYTRYVNNNGTVNTGLINTPRGVSFAFCFGGTSQVNNTFGGACVARKIKKGYVGVDTEVPIYEESVSTVNITASNISDMFAVENGSYYFAGSGGTFTTNNGGVKNSTATTKLTAKCDMDVSFNYSYSSEAKYDKFTLKVAGTTVEDAVSGSTTSKSYSGKLTAGQTIEFTYAKDSSQDSNDDECTFSNMIVTGTVKTQVGTEIKSLARKIKKAYIGIGGVARPCWSGGELAYYGTITGLSQARRHLAATNVGDYALFGGGASYGTLENGTPSSKVDYYNKSLTHGTAASLSVAREQLAATTVGNYALFGGGHESNETGTRIVDAYDKSLVRSEPSTLAAYNSYALAATTVGNYALFGGGCFRETGCNSEVTSYDTSLTRTLPTALSVARYSLAATTVGNYALFGGGFITDNYSAVVDTYDNSLTKGTASGLSTARLHLAATTIGDYALFGGGFYSASGYISVVNAYNKSLTRSTITALSAARDNLSATTVGDFALFGGGYSRNGPSKVVDAYDKSLTRTTPTGLNTARYDLAATTVGDFALFGGGVGSTFTTDMFDTVDAYTVA